MSIYAMRYLKIRGCVFFAPPENLLMCNLVYVTYMCAWHMCVVILSHQVYVNT